MQLWILGGSWVVISGVPFKGPFNGFCRDLGLRVSGFRVVISGVISPLIWVISIVTLGITLLTTTHGPPSK